jgi:hypothetical protein
MLRAYSRAHAVLGFVARTPQAAGLVVSEARARSAAGCHIRHAAFSRAHAVLGFALLALQGCRGEAVRRQDAGSSASS